MRVITDEDYVALDEALLIAALHVHADALNTDDESSRRLKLSWVERFKRLREKLKTGKIEIEKEKTNENRKP